MHYQSDSFSDEREMENPILCFENWKIKFKHLESRPRDKKNIHRSGTFDFFIEVAQDCSLPKIFL